MNKNIMVLALLTVALLNPLSNCKALAVENSIPNEDAEFIVQASEGSNIEANTANPTYLGKIVNSSNGQTFEIDCLQGDQKLCSSFGFFRVTGTREANPFAVLADFNFAAAEGQIHFVRASAWILNADPYDNVQFWWIPPFIIAPAATLTVDALLLPYDIVSASVTKARYNKALRNLITALNTGSTVRVSNRQYQKIIDIVLSKATNK